MEATLVRLAMLLILSTAWRRQENTTTILLLLKAGILAVCKFKFECGVKLALITRLTYGS